MTQPRLTDIYRPYIIVAAFPGHLPRAIGRTYNQTDADHHVRFLQRQITHASFYVVLDPEPQGDLSVGALRDRRS